MTIFDLFAPWRQRLQPASYNGVQFHVDVGMRTSGRRVALHEFPKKDIPYSEDMGRRARHFTVSCYVIGPDYTFTRDDLIEQLEQEGPGLLIHPFGEDLVVVEQYSVTERRERGGIANFEIAFVEAGSNDFSALGIDTQGQVGSAAQNAIAQAKASALTHVGGIGHA